MTPQPSGLGRAISSSMHPGGISTNRRDSGLARSQSENQQAPKGMHHPGGKHHDERHRLNKRKHKLKSKMKYVRETSTPSQKDSSGKPLIANNEEHKQSGLNSPSAHFPNKPQLVGSQQYNADSSDKLLPSALQKLRQRESTRNPNPANLIRKKKKERRDEGSSNERQLPKKEEEALKKEMMMSAKFEMIDVYPLFSKHRLACQQPVKQGDGKTLTFHQVIQVDSETFNVKLSADPTKSLPYDSLTFLSRVYKLPLTKLSAASLAHLAPYLPSPADPLQASLLVATLTPPIKSANLPLVALLPTRDYLPVTLDQSASPLEDLQDLTDDSAHLKDAYGKATEEVLKEAKIVNDAFDEYMSATSKVIVTKDNLEDSLFTIVNYQSVDGVQGMVGGTSAQQEEQKNKATKQGILLRAKFDSTHSQDHILFVRKLGGTYKQGKLGTSIGSHKEVRSEWLQLSKYRILSDISKGFVSLNCLSSVNSDGCNRLKKRNLKLVSYRESLKQRASLRMISNETLEEADSQNKKAPLFRDSSMSPGDRCVTCNYQAQGYDHLRCSCCNKVYHEECVKNDKKLHQLYLGTRELEWRCHDCIRCVNCLSMCGKSQSQQLLICKCCNSAYHFDCLDPNVKMSMPSVQTEISGGNRSLGGANQLPTQEIFFNCERCVQCDQCGAREAGKNRLNKWSKDFKLCSNCNKKRKKNQFCTVCECFWPDEILSDQSPEQDFTLINNKLNEYLNTSMINCGKCGIWVHYPCDRIFEDEGIKKMFLASKGLASDLNYGTSFTNEFLQYHCIDCRQQQRSTLIRQILENLAGEDKQYYFQDPVEDLIQNYGKIIKTPMCFKYIRDRAKGTQGSHYLTDPGALRRDIALIFENAMKFNLPKHKVHKEAYRLGQVCSAVLDSVWTRLELNAQRTLDENMFKQQLRDERNQKLQLSLNEKGLKMLRAQNQQDSQKKNQYQLKFEELFDQSEYQPHFQTESGGGQLGETNIQMTSQDALRRYGGDGLEEEEGIENLEDMDGSDVEGNNYDDDKSELQPGAEKTGSNLKRGRKGGLKGSSSNAAKKRDLRSRKTVDYNEERSELGKRLAVGLNDEGLQRVGSGQYSSKKARYQQQQAQFASQFSLNSIKGANLLQQALHQQEKQNMQSQNIEGNQGSSLAVQQAHASADQAKNPFQEQQAQMIKLYQEIDDERCYYSNPARCSFDDPCLVFEEMCYLCGSFGNRKEFLSCTLCGESFHTYCLQLLPANGNDNDESTPVIMTEEEQQALIAKFQPYWKCLNCKFCDICSSATQEAYLLYCDVCDKAFHSFCWTPQLKLIPKCQWKCSECFKCNKCGTRRFFDPALHMKPGTNHLLDPIVQSCQNDFEFSQNFSLCYECGMNEHKKSFCKICQSINIQLGNSAEEGASAIVQVNNMGRKKSGPKQPVSEEEKMLKCKTCGYYCHIKCSRLLPQIEEEGEEQFDDFKCLECLLTGKTINHLIRETCEHYENMHQIINRHRLLSQLLSDLLTPYFPMQDKAPLFIKAFIDQNQELFRYDPIILDWLSLLETGVTYVQLSPEEESTNNATANDQMMIDTKKEEVKDEDMELDTIKKEVDWSQYSMTEVFQNTSTQVKPKTPAEEAYDKMFGHKETFLPQKRNLYEALASDEGYHRFGQRQHFIDPFSEETQAMITLPIDENLEKEVDFPQLYIDYELKAVMKIKLRFFDWFESMLKTIVERNTTRLQKKRASKQDDSQSLQAIDQSHENATLQSFIMGAHDPPSSTVGEKTGNDHHQQQAHNSNQMCTEEDVMLENPQKRLHCVMCKLKGELKVTGRLIPFQVNQFVHVNCVLWSTDVHEIAEGGYLINFFQVWTTRARFQKCNHCGESGASLYCSSTRSRCQVAYHFPCAYRNNKMAFAPRGVKETYCEGCCKGTRGVSPGLPLEYANTKRRFQIAKNQQPWNMTHHMTNLSLQQQSLLLSSSSLFNAGSTSAADIEKPLQIEKWRPFFFDMFNRVGNMTILSLRKEINQIIEEYCTQFRSTADSSKDLKDFSTVRIYWRHFDLDKEEAKEEDVSMKEGQATPDKTLYLYTNNTMKEVVYRDLEALLPYVCFRVKDKVNLGLHYLTQDQEQMNQLQELREQKQQDFIPAQTFWQKLLHHYTMERARFSLNNIIFSLSEFTGKTKYPVSIWNRCPEGMKNKTFFLRAGEQVLHAQGIQSQAAIAGQNGSPNDRELTRDPSIQGTLAGGPHPVQGFGNIKKGDPLKATSIDDIFKRMTKINQMGDHQNPMASIKRVNASKHMPYEAVLHNLGKKMFYKAPPANSALFEDANLGSNKNKTNAQQDAGAKLKGLQKKARQADTVGGQGGQGGGNGEANSKETDLPVAMKYRMSKTQPKKVEVGPSKIHRNGLFTLEDLAPADIVIEYVGERIRNKVADKREIVYEMKGIGDCYLFRLDKEYIIDATFNGNKARYLNHSCDANCSAKIINVQQQKHIIISANRQIKSGEELTYNYNFDYEADKIECFCGAPGCLGRLN